MMHKGRTWGLGREDYADRIEELAAKISESGNSWTSCTAFRLGRYVIATDQTSEDGAGEWCVLIREGDSYREIESITFSWCSTEKAAEYLRDILAGKYDEYDYGRCPVRRIEEPDQHKGRYCQLCA